MSYSYEYNFSPYALLTGRIDVDIGPNFHTFTNNADAVQYDFESETYWIKINEEWFQIEWEGLNPDLSCITNKHLFVTITGNQIIYTNMSDEEYLYREEGLYSPKYPPGCPPLRR